MLNGHGMILNGLIKSLLRFGSRPSIILLLVDDTRRGSFRVRIGYR